MTDRTPSPELPAPTADLPGGGRMPLLGFGTWQIRGPEATAAATAALEAGYRHLDTATVYGNEAEVGRALEESGVPRDEVFVTTKCPPERTGEALEVLERSLDALGTDHVDLWLIHWPGDSGGDLELWKAFVKARESGLARDIGVSNFTAAMIDELTGATEVQPAVNQIKWSPLLFDPATVEEHRTRGIVLEGYSALRGGTLENATISGIADELGRTPAQVIVRWHLQHGTVVIPKSRNADRIRSNADVFGFELTEEQMTTLDGLGRAS